eukprot:COSAG01_NODE_10688_length_2104_cov_18.637406_2_plen_415_part_00
MEPAASSDAAGWEGAKLRACESRLQQMRSWRREYQELRGSLAAMPERTHHDVLVPLGSVAFMPGRLVRTNEVTVLLGDNYFAERSAKQACELLDRRIEHVAKMANEEEAAMDKLIERRLRAAQVRAQVSKIKPRNEQGEEMVDIREEYIEPGPGSEPSQRTKRTAAQLQQASIALLDGAHCYGLSAEEYSKLLPEMENDELRSAIDDFAMPQPPPDTNAEALRGLLRQHLTGSGCSGGACDDGGGAAQSADSQDPTRLETAGQGAAATTLGAPVRAQEESPTGATAAAACTGRAGTISSSGHTEDTSISHRADDCGDDAGKPDVAGRPSTVGLLRAVAERGVMANSRATRTSVQGAAGVIASVGYTGRAQASQPAKVVGSSINLTTSDNPAPSDPPKKRISKFKAKRMAARGET